MKIVVGSIQQEVNTFSPIKPTKEDFFYLHGEDMIDQIAVTPLFRENGVEIIPTVYGNAVPSGWYRNGIYRKYHFTQEV